MTTARVTVVLLLAWGAAGAVAAGAQQPQVGSWVVDPAARVSIGQATGADEYVLVNVIDATVLSDGTIVLGLFLSRSVFSVRYYTPDGSHVASAGGFGDGPFELSAGFVSLDRIQGDSVMIVARDHRFAVFGPRGESGRTGRLTLPARARPVGALSKDRLLLWESGAVDDREVASGVNRYHDSYLLHDVPTGSTEAIPSSWITRGALDQGTFLHLPFEPSVAWGIGGGRVWIGSGARPRVEGFGRTGIRMASINLGESGRAVTREDVQRWKRDDLDGVGGARRRVFERHHDRVDFPESMPVFQSIDVTHEGVVWVLRYSPPWEVGPYVFDLFDESGRGIGLVTVPFEIIGPRLRRRDAVTSPLLEVGADYILVRDQGSYDEPVIKMYRLVSSLRVR